MSNKSLLKSRLERFTGDLVLPLEGVNVAAFIRDVIELQRTYGTRIKLLWILEEEITPIQDQGAYISDYISSLLLILQVLLSYGRKRVFGSTHFTYLTTDFAAGTITVQDDGDVLLTEIYTHGEIEIERYSPGDLGSGRKRWLLVRNE